jgi:type I restriction enzyme S subunit
MKISYADYIKKTDVSVLVAEAIFSNLEKKYPHKKISEVAETTSGGTPLRSNTDFYGGNIPWLKSGELKDGLIESAEEYITEIGLKNSSAKLLPENTLLLAMYGATAGRTGITKIKAATNQAICAIFPKSHITQEYLYWFLRQYRYNFIDISKGGAQPNISQSVINATKIPIPDISLQNQISDILSQIEANGTIDITVLPFEFRDKVNKVFASKNKVEAISNELTHQLTLVKKLRQQLLQDAVQGKLTAEYRSSHPELVEGSHHASELLKKIKAEKEKSEKSGKSKKSAVQTIKAEEVPFEIPEGWVWCRLGEIAYITSGSTPAQSAFIESGIPYLKMYNLRNQKIDFFYKPQYIKEDIHNGQLKRCRAFPGDVIMNIVGPPLGKIAIIPDSLPECNFNQAAVLIRPFLKEMNQFIFWYLNELSEIKAIETKGVAGQDNISVTQAHNMRVPLPPLSEQNRIVQKLDILMQTCDALEASIKESAAQNEKLLQQVLREALKKSEG